MYLKNTSQTAAVILNTVVGKIGIKPNEIINIEHKILPPIPDKIVKVTQEEYLSFRKMPAQPLEQMQDNEEQDVNDDGQADTEAIVDSVQDIIEDMSKTLADNSALDFVKSLLTPNFQPLSEEPDVDPLQITQTDGLDEAAQLEKQIEDLKQTWKNAPTPKKKDKIYKQIKELQKQLQKVKKEDADE